MNEGLDLKLGKAIIVLQEALINDENFRSRWTNEISNSFINAEREHKLTTGKSYLNQKDTYIIVEIASENFLRTFCQSPCILPSSHQEDVLSNVTTRIFDIALRMCGIQLGQHLVDSILDVVELLSNKGSNATIGDTEELLEMWRKDK